MPVFKVIHVQEPLYTAMGPKYHDDNALESVIAYCQNETKTNGKYVGGIAVHPTQAALEMELLARAYGANDGLRLRHWILSFSRNEIRKYGKHVYEVLNTIAWYAASYYGYEYQIVYAVHQDTEHPHIHFVMNTVNHRTGHKYGGKKEDYYAYQRYLDDFLRQYGMHLETYTDKGSNTAT